MSAYTGTLRQLELGASLGYWGFTTGDSTLPQIGVAIAAPLVAAIAWGMFGSPKAPIRRPRPAMCPRSSIEHARAEVRWYAHKKGTAP